MRITLSVVNLESFCLRTCLSFSLGPWFSRRGHYLASVSWPVSGTEKEVNNHLLKAETQEEKNIFLIFKNPKW